MSDTLLKSLIAEQIQSYLNESRESDLVESIFNEVSEETWEAIEEAILNELSPETLRSYKDKANVERVKHQRNYYQKKASAANSQERAKKLNPAGTRMSYAPPGTAERIAEPHKDAVKRDRADAKQSKKIADKRADGVELANKKLGITDIYGRNPRY